MELLLHQVLAGLATGGIYACLALALVMIYQAIDHLNFAQGEMAMFSTFIAWQLIQWGFPYWVAFGATIVISFAAGVLIYGFAAAVLGGLTSPFGAVVGGFLVGVFENLAGTYIPGVGNELKLPIALALIISVLVVKPAGLFGRHIVKRV